MCWTVEDTISYIPSEDGIDSFWFFFTFIFLFHNLCLPPSLSSFLKGGRINISIFWINISILIIVVQLLSHANPLQSHGPQHARLPCPSVSWSLLKLVSIEWVMPSNHLILCCPLLLLPSLFPSIRFLSNELACCIRWPKDWSFGFGVSPSSKYSGLI